MIKSHAQKHGFLSVNRRLARADFVGFRQSVLGLTLTDSSIREIPTHNGTHGSSEGDLSRLKAMGYIGQEDVAKRIITATDLHLSRLPLPESFSH